MNIFLIGTLLLTLSGFIANLFKREQIFVKHHTDRYLMQCFYNLQEKYDRGQKDFDRETYEKLLKFICEQEKGATNASIY